jgi:hypothetical protein
MFNLYNEYPTTEACEGFGDFRTGGQVIRTVEHTDDFVLLTKEETVLQGMTDRLTETGKCCAMEINVGKTKVKRISWKSTSLQIVVDQKQPEKVEYFTYLDSMITKDARCTRKIKSRTAMAKAAFNRKKTLHKQTECKFKEATSKVLHLEHSFV